MKKFLIGEHLTNPAKKIYWNLDEVTNPHLLIVGMSGAGKTFLLRKILNFLDEENIKTFVIDFHSDLGIENEQEIKFTNVNPEYGIGVFEFEKEDIDSGIYGRIDDLLGVFKNSFFTTFSPLREGVLRRLMLDIYYQKGFDPDDPSTWDKELPTLEDLKQLIVNLKDYIESKDKKNLILNENLLLLNDIYKAALKDEKASENINEYIAKAENIFEKFLEDLKRKSSKNFDESNIKDTIQKKLKIKDISFYDNKNILKTLEQIELYIDIMIESKVFSKYNPILDKNKNIYRFNLSKLSDNVMFFLANLIMQRVFNKARKLYKYNRKDTSNKIKTYIVIDESKLVLPSGKDKENPFNVINRIVSESRKFGLGIILVSQRLSHYSEEIISNIATKIILRVSENEKQILKRKIGVDDKILTAINSRKYGIAAVKIDNNLYPVLLDGAKR